MTWKLSESDLDTATDAYHGVHRDALRAAIEVGAQAIARELAALNEMLGAKNHDEAVQKLRDLKIAADTNYRQATGRVSRSTGCRDRNGNLIHLGDKVRYSIQGEHTKPEYWNPEYEVIFRAPCFGLKHIGGGKDAGNHQFILKAGGGNGDLEIIP